MEPGQSKPNTPKVFMLDINAVTESLKRHFDSEFPPAEKVIVYTESIKPVESTGDAPVDGWYQAVAKLFTNYGKRQSHKAHVKFRVNAHSQVLKDTVTAA